MQSSIDIHVTVISTRPNLDCSQQDPSYIVAAFCLWLTRQAFLSRQTSQLRWDHFRRFMPNPHDYSYFNDICTSVLVGDVIEGRSKVLQRCSTGQQRFKAWMVSHLFPAKHQSHFRILKAIFEYNGDLANYYCQHAKLDLSPKLESEWLASMSIITEAMNAATFSEVQETQNDNPSG